MSQATILKINVQLIADKPTDVEDSDVEGMYEVELHSSTDGMPKEKLASIALDVFHSNIGIGTLEDFVISALDSDLVVLDEDESHEPYSGSKLGAVYKVDEQAMAI